MDNFKLFIFKERKIKRAKLSQLFFLFSCLQQDRCPECDVLRVPRIPNAGQFTLKL